MREPRILIYASFLLDLSLLKVDFLQFKTSHLTLSALAIALHREQKITGKSYQEKLIYMQEVMKIENYTHEQFKACKDLFNNYRRRAQAG